MLLSITVSFTNPIETTSALFSRIAKIADWKIENDLDFAPVDLVHVQNFGGVASRVPWGWRDSFGKTGNLAGWVTKVCLKCTEKLG